MFGKSRWPQTIRTRLMFGFGTILLVSFASSAIGYSSLRRLAYSSRVSLEQAAQVRELSLELKSNFLQARQSEEAYLNHWKKAQIKQRSQELIQDNQKHLTDAYDNLVALKQIEGEESDLSEELALLESLFINYESAFQTTAQRILSGAEDDAFHQKMQATIEAISQVVDGADYQEIQAVLWAIAAKEQAYFNTGDPQYLTEVRSSLDRLVYLLNSTDFSTLKSDREQLTQDYIENLNTALLLDQQIRVNAIVADNINREIDRIIQTIGNTSQARAQAARLNLAQTANQSSIALLVTALSSLGLTIWASLWLGKRIMVPITALHQAAERIGQGDLEYHLHLPGDDEFSVVAQTFNKMVSQLRHTLADLEQRVSERTIALATSNTSLQEKTQSLEMALRQLRDSETNYRSLLEHLQAGVVVHSRDTTILLCNQMACQLLGATAEELIGLTALKPTWHFVDEFGSTLTVDEYPVNQVIRSQVPIYNYVVGIKHGNSNQCVWVLVNAFPAFDDDLCLQTVVVTFIDITERKLAEEELRHRALHDALTGLPNRTLLIERLDHAIHSVQRRPDSLFAVLFIDLNRFKVINDSLGHNIGDELLIQVADILLSHVRVSDTVARLGGDEFVILLEQIVTPHEAIHVVERIQADLTMPMTLMGHTMFTSASIGIALSNPSYRKGQDILRDADNAMYRAKAKGQSGYEIFDPEMHKTALRLLQLETDLRHAIANQEFCLNYQPIIDLNSQALIGFEALVRWQHPEKGLMSPGEFIPLAEETGLIIPLSEWILQGACRQMRYWCETIAGAEKLKMSVNIAAGLFQNAQFFETLDQILWQTQLPAKNLKLEVTESVLLENADAVLTTLFKLKKRNIEISLDDFGTGYSSLSYLKRFPIDTLKIDKSFVDSLEHDGDASIVEAIIQIANSLDMSVIAEGVETFVQWNWLKRLNCGAIQGYLVAPPMSAEKADSFMSRSFYLTCDVNLPVST